MIASPGTFPEAFVLEQQGRGTRPDIKDRQFKNREIKIAILGKDAKEWATRQLPPAILLAGHARFTDNSLECFAYRGIRHLSCELPGLRVRKISGIKD